MCRPTDACSTLTAHQHDTMRAGLDSDGDGAWDYDLQVSNAKLQLIPVVTFLAPLASNSEGLKDR